MSSVARAVVVALMMVVSACGDSTTEPTATSQAPTTQGTTTSPSTTQAVITQSTTTTAPVTVDQIVGEWSRESAEHGSEFLRFAADGGFVYAEGDIANLDAHPSVIGTFAMEDGALTLVTDDCGEVVGSYSPRLFGAFLEIRSLGDSCTGREDGLTFGFYSRIDG